jgi:hypothetical protein
VIFGTGLKYVKLYFNAVFLNISSAAEPVLKIILHVSIKENIN